MSLEKRLAIESEAIRALAKKAGLKSFGDLHYEFIEDLISYRTNLADYNRKHGENLMVASEEFELKDSNADSRYTNRYHKHKTIQALNSEMSTTGTDFSSDAIDLRKIAFNNWIAYADDKQGKIVDDIRKNQDKIKKLVLHYEKNAHKELRYALKKLVRERNMEGLDLELEKEDMNLFFKNHPNLADELSQYALMRDIPDVKRDYFDGNAQIKLMSSWNKYEISNRPDIQKAVFGKTFGSLEELRRELKDGNVEVNYSNEKSA